MAIYQNYRETDTDRELIGKLKELDNDSFVNVVKSACWARGRDLREGAPTIGETVGEVIADAVNGAEYEFAQGLYGAFKRQHRTLQQGIVRAWLSLLDLWSREAKGKQEMYIDMRNEAAFRIAKKLENEGLPLI